MSRISSGTGMDRGEGEAVPSAGVFGKAKSPLTKAAAWITDRNIAFVVISIGMIVMLLWAGAFKMTARGAEVILPLVTHSPLTSWQFKVLGPYVGADIIGGTEWTAALLFIVGVGAGPFALDNRLNAPKKK